MLILRDNPKRGEAEAGFSLIEVLVVLAIFATLASIVGINLRKAVHAARVDATKDAVIQIVKTTRAQATYLGEFVAFDDARRGHPMEQDTQSIFFAAEAGAEKYGVCDATEGQLVIDGAEYVFRIAPFTCEVSYDV
jgi:prepilin-type N-terminal cleavage/methylation domain-containing protein